MSPVAATDFQEEFILSAPASPDTRHFSRQLAAIHRELALRQRGVLRTVGRWLDLYEYAQLLEQDQWGETPPAAQRRFYLGALSLVHGLGELLLARLQNDDAEQLHQLGLTYADLAACVEEVGGTHRAARSDLTPEMIAEMNARFFSRAG